MIFLAGCGPWEVRCAMKLSQECVAIISSALTPHFSQATLLFTSKEPSFSFYVHERSYALFHETVVGLLETYMLENVKFWEHDSKATRINTYGKKQK